MNSLLQTLYMTPEFRNGVLKWSYDEERDEKKDECITFQMQVLFVRLQLSSQR